MATGWGSAGGGGAWGRPANTPIDHDDDEDTYTPPPVPLYAQQQQPQHNPYASTFQNSGILNNNVQPSSNAAASLAAREAELNKKEKELAAKEKKLKSLEEDLVASGAVIKKKNWPWLTAMCGYPMLYHSIADEIPDKSKRVVREMYICWWGLFCCLLWNFFCSSNILGTSAGSERISSWFLAVIYALMGIPLSFWGWYLSVYNAAKQDSTYRYIFFFVGFCCHIGFCLYVAIGFGFSSAAWCFAGWISAFQAFQFGTYYGVIYIIGACLWSCETAFSCWCLKDAYLFFRGAGGIEKAKQDAAVAAFRQGMQSSSAV